MILCSGAFDGLHAGHIRYLEAAKQLCLEGEELWCAVAPDSYIRQTKQREPHWSQTERLATVCALRLVDYGWSQRSETIAALVRFVAPRLVVKGEDWIDRVPTDVIKACDEIGCEIRFVHTPGRHVSEAIGVTDATQ